MKILKPLFMLAMIFSVSIADAEIKKMVTVFETTKEIASAKEIEIEGRFCKVSLTQAEGQSSTLSGKLEAMKEHSDYNIVVEENGATAKITVVVPADAFSSFVGEMSLAVGKGVKVTVNNTSGYVDINGITGSRLIINTTQGKITAENCEGEIDLNSKNGTITASKMKGTITTTSSRGDQTLSDLEGTLSFDSPDGSLMVTNAKGTVKGNTVAGLQTYQHIDGDLTIKGSSGAIRVSNSQGVFNITTMSASVNLFEVKAELHIETTKGPIVGQKGITLTASSDFTTTEGKIQMRLTNAKEELTFQLSSESSKAAIIAKGTSKKKKLNSGKGAIVITGKTRTGGQVYS